MAKRTEQDKAWFRSQVVQLETRLIRYSRKITGNLEAAKDVVQESFLKLWDQERASVEGHVVPWLYTVCRNRSIDYLRKESGKVGLEEETQVSTASYPEEELQKMEVFQKIASLRSKYQEVLLLKFQEGMSYKEISKVTGHSVSHVGLLIHEGMRELKKHFQEGGSNE